MEEELNFIAEPKVTEMLYDEMNQADLQLFHTIMSKGGTVFK